MRHALLLALATLSACATWRPVPPHRIGGAGEAGRPEQVRLHLDTGEAVVIRGPVLVGDSVVGTVGGVRAAFAVEDLWWADVREVDEGRTAAVVGGGLATVGLVALVVVTAVEATRLVLTLRSP